ncbi:MAG: hypothetical protein LDL39_10935 [Magnetospirillum sp.]|nr:hypothetical protein [Magnetospirillum sp.]
MPLQEGTRTLEQRFTTEQLAKIIDEATIYMCACPAQVAEQIIKLRDMVRYQEDCQTRQDTDSVVHRTIATAGMRSLQILEDCLDQVLEIEGWDRATLKMPEGLRQRRDSAL